MNLKQVIISALLGAATAFHFSSSFAANGNPDDAGYVIEQTIFISGLNNPESTGEGARMMITVPLKRVGRLFMIEATIDNETGNFLFDTGSQQLVLNSIYFRKYMTTGEVPGGGVNGAVGNVSRTRVKKLDVAGIINYDINADVTDLGHIESRRGVKVFGLFGFSIFKNLEVVIDAAHNQMILYRLDKNGRRLTSQESDVHYDIVNKTELIHNVLFLQATVGGRMLNFCFDTGAESNVINSWLPGKVMNTVTITRRTDLRGVGAANADVLYGSMNDFSIGNRQVRGMQVIITSLESMAAAFDHSLDGMLGFDFLQQGIISVNLVTKELKVAFAKGGKS